VEELRRLDAFLTAEGNGGQGVRLFLIAGTAGAGKTSLALHWAHRVEDRFPHGQLYVNLRGYDPGEPVDAREALARFLDALGVGARAVPSGTEAAAALYRSVLAERRMLIVLDNAATAAQVRPLLPGNSRCLVLVTSRGRLPGLAIHDGARSLTLGPLPEAEAVGLLRAVTADHRPHDDSGKLAELARRCARLPLALRIAAERALMHPHMDMEDLIEDLRDESLLWDALSTGEDSETEQVRSVFAWSYGALSPDSAWLFRLLGLHPGPGFSTGAVSALTGVGVRRTRQLLDTLVGAHLVDQTSPNRYEFHDLLRAFAADQTRKEESPEDRSAALRRVLDWYLHTADAAQSWIDPAEDHLALDPPDDACVPQSFSGYDEAVDWSEREHANFLPAVRAACDAGLDRHGWQLSTVLWNAQAPSSPVVGWQAMGELGLLAARRLGDRAAEAGLLERLGFAHTETGLPDRGLDCHRQALEIRRELGDRYGEAASLNALGLLHMRRRELTGAQARFRQAMAVFHELGAAHWEFVALSNLAAARQAAGLTAEAADDVGRALAAHREHGDRATVGDALRTLSLVLTERGDPLGGLKTAEEAVDLALELRDRVLEGYWLLALGNAQQALARYDEALVSYDRSATLHRRLGDRTREALAWHGAGRTHHRMGQNDRAADFHRRAAAAHHELGDTWNEAQALDGLATALCAEEPERAREHWDEALRLLAGYDDPRAVRMRDGIGDRLGG
jgi:tetratricopeptide (TPR) repeat protein